MNFTEKRILQKIVALLLIMIMTIADFSIIGENLISYAIDRVATNSDNVEFFAYFINNQGEKVANIESPIDVNDLTMNIEVAVKNEGYFYGKIELGDSSFKFVKNMSNDYIKEIKDNVITLNQIKAGTTANIEIGIEFNNLEKINISALNQENYINLVGTYVSSKKDIEIKGRTSVGVNWVSPENTQAQLDTKILTNSIYKDKDIDKRIVQILVDSKLKNNIYPVKETKIELNIPGGAEEVKVHSRSTYATNGEESKFEYNCNLELDEPSLTIISNNDGENGRINWNKKVKDTFVVTYVYPVDIIFNYEKINSFVTITTYDNKEFKNESHALISENVDGIVTSEIVEKEDKIYKGKIYTGEKRNYTSTTLINIDYSDIVQRIQLLEEEVKFKTENQERDANIQFIKTKINKNKFVRLFGEDGYIKISDIKDNVLHTINNLSETDENGNIVVEYDDNVKAIVIETSTPKSNGVLNLVHTKSILESKLSRQEIKELVEIKEQVNSNITKKDGNSFKNETINTIALEETSSDANIIISKEKLSTITENKDVEIVATLETNGENKDLYKNPTVKIIFPKEIKEVNVSQAKALYRNGLDVANVSQEKNNDGNIVLTVKFKGEQTKYDSDILNGLELHFFANIVVDKSTPSKEVSLKMEYTNENGIKDSYEVETKIELESQYGLMIYNKIEDVNSNDESVETIDENKEEVKLDVNKQSVTAKVSTSLINNYSKTIGRTEIIGRIPNGEDENTLDSTIIDLKVNDTNAKIYYNKKVDAKTNDNYWTQDSKDAKSYKIVIDNIEAGKVVKVTYGLEINEKISYNMRGSLLTEVAYTYGDKEINKVSNIEFLTEEIIEEEPVEGDKIQTESEIELNIVAVSGNKQLNNGDCLYDGETIKYMITLKNNSGKDYKDILVKAIQTNGKIFDLVGTEVYNPVIYDGEGKAIENYWKITDSNTKEFSNISIKNGEAIKLEYQAVVSKTEGEETFAEIFVTSNESSLKEELTTNKYKIKDAELKMLFTPAVSEECYWTTDSVQQVNLDITNVLDKDLENVEVKIAMSEGLTCDKYEDYIDWSSDIKVKIKNKEVNSIGQTVITVGIERIEAGKTAQIYLRPYILDIKGNKANVEFFAKATTFANNVYSSNTIIREVIQEKKQIKVEQIAKINGIGANKDTVVKNGDKVDYFITVKNEDKEKAILSIYNYVNTGLDVRNITLVKNDNTKTDITNEYKDQNFIHEISLNAGQEINIIISAVLDTTYIKGQSKVTNTVVITDTETSAIYTSEVELALKVEKVDDGKLNIEILQESNLDNNSVIKTGDKIEYIAKIKNIGDFDREINIYDYINSTIRNVKILIDEKDVTEKYLIDNDLKIEKYTIKANATMIIKIVGTFDLKNYIQNSVLNEFIIKSDIADIKSNSITYYTSLEEDNKKENENEDIPSQDIPVEINNYTVNGTAWIDSNKNGKRDSNEELIKDMVVKAINTQTKEVLSVSATTMEDGSYSLQLPEAKYIIVFMYNNEEYYITTYQAKKVNKDFNSDAITKSLNIDGKNTIVGTTDILDLTENKNNIDIGLIFRKKFDIQLEKYVTKIVVTNNEGTKTYNFDNEDLAKIEIASKYLSGSKVVVEYTIKVKNVGDIDGYVKNIVDYMPSDMTFSSNLNKNWYQSGKDLYNEELSEKKLEPGESSKVTLVLTKTMTESNTGLVNNTAEIESSYNEKSFLDDNTDNNTGLADVIIGVKTGAAVKLVVLTFGLTIMIAVIAYFITKKYLSRMV